MTNRHDTPALTIAARPPGGFRRCGVHHPPRAVDHPAGRFSEAEMAALRAEPNLVVVVRPAPAGGDNTRGGPKAGADQSAALSERAADADAGGPASGAGGAAAPEGADPAPPAADPAPPKGKGKG